MKEDTDCDTHDLIKCPCTPQPTAKMAYELDDYDFDVDDDRDCQLGSAPSTKGKDAHKTLDQLMEWQHYGSPFPLGAFEVSTMHSIFFLNYQIICYSNISRIPVLKLH